MSHCQPCGPLQMTRRTQLSSGVREFCKEWKTMDQPDSPAKTVQEAGVAAGSQ